VLRLIESTTISYSIPCEILEFDIEVIPEGAHPEMEAFGILLHQQLEYIDVNTLPVSLISRLIRKGLIYSESLDFSSLDSPLLDNLSTEELLKDLLQRRNREITTFKVVRDRMFGTLSIVENMHSSSKDSPHQIIPCKPSLPPFEDLKQKDRNYIGLIEPHKGRLSRMLDVDLHEVSKQINLIGEIRVETAEMERQFYQRETKEGKVKWVSSMRGYDLLSKKLMQTQPELKLREEQHSIQTDWQLPTEQRLLDVLSEPNPTGKGNNLSSIHNQIFRTRANEIAGFLRVLYNEFTSEEHKRLASVLPVVGTEEQQWDAAIEVMRSGNRDTLLLSAFTNVNFVEDINNIMNLTNIDEANEIHLTVGEPDRVNEQEYRERTAQYSGVLGRKVSTTKIPSHAKFVVSDTGKFWIGSCNLLSSSPGSQISETGVLVDDPKAALLLLEHVESWFREDEFETIERMKLELRKIEPKPLIYVEELNVLIEDTRAYIEVPDESKGRKEYNKLAKSVKGFLKKIKSKPRFSFLTTEKHRSFVIDSIALAQTSISLASDQLRPIGFDLTIRNLILRKYEKSNPTFSTFETRIYWGRQWDKSPHFDDEVEAGKVLIDSLRKECKKAIMANASSKKKGKEVRFFPRHTQGPMSNHSKFLIQDGYRTLVTSLNLFGGKSEEFQQVDATELGIVIDCERVGQIIEGEMDLMMGTEYIDRRMKYLKRMFRAALHTAFIDLGGTFTLEELMDKFFSRIFKNEHLTTLWNNYMSGFPKINNSLEAAFVLLYDLKSILILIDTTDGSLLSFDLMRQAIKVGGPDFELTPYKIEVEW
jgi:phosphatidylserine/phosphatidylglycerophosphate/cardiolipin synthase-like enzyme